MGYFRKRKVVLIMVRATLVLMAFPALHSLSPATAAAASLPSKQTKEKTARKACLSGDYEKGVGILSDLFVETKDPTHIFNQARCFEQNRRYEDAIGRFQEYLRAAPDLSPTDKALANKHIADCQDLLVNPPGRAAALPAPAATREQLAPRQDQASHPPSSIANSEPPALVTVPQSVPPSAAAGSGLRTGGIATASVGAAALVGGLLLNWKANSMADDLGTYGGYSDSKKSQRKSYETASWVGYGVGTICVVAGGVLYYLGTLATSPAPAGMALVPVLGPDVLGATLGGTF